MKRLNVFVRWFRKLGLGGLTRFRITRLGYKLFWQSYARNGEWDFVLQYIPDLHSLMNKKTMITVLDIGSSESLLIYELDHRGYKVFGLDQRDYQEPLKNIPFFKVDISDPDLKINPGNLGSFYYIVAVSTIEHVGLGAYGDPIRENGDRLALENIYKLLREDGYFIITVPMKYWDGPTGRGYNYYEFKRLIDGLFDIFNICHKGGQICAVLVKTGMRDIKYKDPSGQIRIFRTVEGGKVSY